MHHFIPSFRFSAWSSSSTSCALLTALLGACAWRPGPLLVPLLGCCARLAPLLLEPPLWTLLLLVLPPPLLLVPPLPGGPFFSSSEDRPSSCGNRHPQTCASAARNSDWCSRKGCLEHLSAESCPCY